MAIITCKECAAKISSKAAACPQCGAKSKKGIGCGGIFIGGVILVVGFIVIGTGSILTSASSPATNTASNSDTPNPTNTNSQPRKSILIVQKKIDDEFIQYCIDSGWVTYIEQNYTNNFYVRLPSNKYTTKENIESIATYIAKAYVMQNMNKGGANTSATVHVFKGDDVVARGRYGL